MKPPHRTPRSVQIADHVWEAFEEMARAMGSERDGLINQAMFMFARLNGFLDAGAAPRAVEPQDRSARPTPVGPIPVQHTQIKAPKTIAPLPPRAPEPLVDKLLETPEIDFGSSPAALPPLERTPATAAPTGERGLFLESEYGEQRVAKDRFVIGRGKHCDFVINSGKVSREHAAVVREGDDWYVEDLGSSNGTWFNKQRIKRRKIESGDEFFVCSERMRFTLR